MSSSLAARKNGADQEIYKNGEGWLEISDFFVGSRNPWLLAEAVELVLVFMEVNLAARTCAQILASEEPIQSIINTVIATIIDDEDSDD